jgi:hypothetical protein
MKRKPLKDLNPYESPAVEKPVWSHGPHNCEFCWWERHWWWAIWTAPIWAPPYYLVLWVYFCIFQDDEAWRD